MAMLEVIRNPLRSLLMKIDTTSLYTSVHKCTDVKKVTVNSDLLDYFQPIGTWKILTDNGYLTIR